MTLSEKYAQGLFNDWLKVDAESRVLMLRDAYMQGLTGFLRLVEAHESGRAA